MAGAGGGGGGGDGSGDGGGCRWRWWNWGKRDRKRRARERKDASLESVGDSCRGVAGSISVDRRHKLFQWTQSSGSIVARAFSPSTSLRLTRTCRAASASRPRINSLLRRSSIRCFVRSFVRPSCSSLLVHFPSPPLFTLSFCPDRNIISHSTTHSVSTNSFVICLRFIIISGCERAVSLGNYDDDNNNASFLPFEPTFLFKNI